MFFEKSKRRFSLCITLGLAIAGLASTGNIPKLLDLGATECIPCKKMAPILEELEKDMKGRMVVEFIDVWKNPAEAPKYKVTTIPTQIFFASNGKELWRHVGFISREDILAQWKSFGYDFSAKDEKPIERWKPLRADNRPQETVCHMCDGDINSKTQVTVHAEKGAVRLCSPHCYFIMYSCLTEDKAGFEDKVMVTDWDSGKQIPLTQATYAVSLQTDTGRPVIKAFASRAAGEKAEGSLLTFAALKQKELSTRCGFCDRSVYPEDAALVKVGPGLHSHGCCAHCALGVAARTGMDIEVHQPDGLTGEPIIIKTLNGSVASLEPKTAVAWFGMRQKPDGSWGSAGCFHQGNFVSQENLKQWLKEHPYETGKQITISQALADKMKLSPQQIQKACKIGECAPK
jgi:thioredoxin 1